MKTNYFSIKRDNEYPFFCQACLTGKPLSEMSKKDARYCVECQPVVEYEYALAAEHRGRQSKYVELVSRELGVAKEKNIMLRTNSDNTHEYRKEARPPLLPSRGRPRKDIPIDLIQKLSKQGASIRQIARELKDYKLSPMSISRVLSGERK